MHFHFIISTYFLFIKFILRIKIQQRKQVISIYMNNKINGK